MAPSASELVVSIVNAEKQPYPDCGLFNLNRANESHFQVPDIFQGLRGELSAVSSEVTSEQ